MSSARSAGIPNKTKSNCLAYNLLSSASAQVPGILSSVVISFSLSNITAISCTVSRVIRITSLVVVASVCMTACFITEFLLPRGSSVNCTSSPTIFSCLERSLTSLMNLLLSLSEYRIRLCVCKIENRE